MGSQGTPKITQNRKKSIRGPLRNPSGSPSRRDREKCGSRALPETSPCASQTINTMVLARSTNCPWTTFSVALGLISAPFGALGAPKRRPGGEKGGLQKNMKKRPPNQWGKVSKMTSKRSFQILSFWCFWRSGRHSAPGRAPRAHFLRFGSIWASIF